MSAPFPARLSQQPDSSLGSAAPQRPEPTPLPGPSATPNESNATIRPDVAVPQSAPRKKRNHRGGKKKRPRRQSFAVTDEEGSRMLENPHDSRSGQSQSAARSSFYRIQGSNLSNTSLESEALLDHRLVATPL